MNSERNFEHRITKLESDNNSINSTLMRMEKRLDSIDSRFDKIDSKLDKMDSKIDSNFKWLLNTIITSFLFNLGLFGSVLGLMAHGFHWIK